MRRARFAAVVAASALPLLALTVWAAGRAGTGAAAAAVALWALGVAFLAWSVWRDAVAPFEDLLAELGTADGAEARWAARDLARRAEEAQRRAERYRTLLEDVIAGFGAGVMVLDRAMRLRIANDAARRFAGAALPAGTLLPEAVREPEVLAAAREALGGRRPRPALVERPAGVWEVRAAPLAGGGAVVVLDDVSVVRRAAELRRRFVEDLAHELRSPLAALRTAVEGLADELEPEDAALVVRQVERLTRLAGELGELATIESGELELAPERLRLRRVAEEAAADLEPAARRAEVTVSVEVPHELELVSDRRAVGRILRNLVENAIRYNRPGGAVSVRGERSRAGVRLEVADTGVGIPAAEVGAVFQRFYRVDRGRTPGAGGLGLGLAIVKHLVHRLGGEVELTSREGVGTTVTVTLPELGAGRRGG